MFVASKNMDLFSEQLYNNESEHWRRLPQQPPRPLGSVARTTTNNIYPVNKHTSEYVSLLSPSKASTSLVNNGYNAFNVTRSKTSTDHSSANTSKHIGIFPIHPSHQNKVKKKAGYGSQPERFSAERQAVAECRLTKQNTQIMPHRMEQPYYIHGSNIDVTEHQTNHADTIRHNIHYLDQLLTSKKMRDSTETILQQPLNETESPQENNDHRTLVNENASIYENTTVTVSSDESNAPRNQTRYHRNPPMPENEIETGSYQGIDATHDRKLVNRNKSICGTKIESSQEKHTFKHRASLGFVSDTSRGSRTSDDIKINADHMTAKMYREIHALDPGERQPFCGDSRERFSIISDLGVADAPSLVKCRSVSITVSVLHCIDEDAIVETGTEIERLAPSVKAYRHSVSSIENKPFLDAQVNRKRSSSLSGAETKQLAAFKQSFRKSEDSLNSGLKMSHDSDASMARRHSQVSNLSGSSAGRNSIRSINAQLLQYNLTNPTNEDVVSNEVKSKNFMSSLVSDVGILDGPKITHSKSTSISVSVLQSIHEEPESRVTNDDRPQDVNRNRQKRHSIALMESISQGNQPFDRELEHLNRFIQRRKSLQPNVSPLSIHEFTTGIQIKEQPPTESDNSEDIDDFTDDFLQNVISAAGFSNLDIRNAPSSTASVFVLEQINEDEPMKEPFVHSQSHRFSTHAGVSDQIYKQNIRKRESFPDIMAPWASPDSLSPRESNETMKQLIRRNTIGSITSGDTMVASVVSSKGSVFFEEGEEEKLTKKAFIETTDSKLLFHSTPTTPSSKHSLIHSNEISPKFSNENMPEKLKEAWNVFCRSQENVKPDDSKDISPELSDILEVVEARTGNIEEKKIENDKKFKVCGGLLTAKYLTPRGSQVEVDSGRQDKGATVDEGTDYEDIRQTNKSVCENVKQSCQERYAKMMALVNDEARCDAILEKFKGIYYDVQTNQMSESDLYPVSEFGFVISDECLACKADEINRGIAETRVFKYNTNYKLPNVFLEYDEDGDLRVLDKTIVNYHHWDSSRPISANCPSSEKSKKKKVVVLLPTERKSDDHRPALTLIRNTGFAPSRKTPNSEVHASNKSKIRDKLVATVISSENRDGVISDAPKHKLTYSKSTDSHAPRRSKHKKNSTLSKSHDGFKMFRIKRKKKPITNDVGLATDIGNIASRVGGTVSRSPTPNKIPCVLSLATIESISDVTSDTSKKSTKLRKLVKRNSEKSKMGKHKCAHVRFKLPHEKGGELVLHGVRMPALNDTIRVKCG